MIVARMYPYGELTEAMSHGILDMSDVMQRDVRRLPSSSAIHPEGTMNTFDRRPLAAQLRDRIWSMVQGEHYRAGDQLPSEQKLAAHLGSVEPPYGRH